MQVQCVPPRIGCKICSFLSRFGVAGVGRSRFCGCRPETISLIIQRLSSGSLSSHGSIPPFWSRPPSFDLTSNACDKVHHQHHDLLLVLVSCCIFFHEINFPPRLSQKPHSLAHAAKQQQGVSQLPSKTPALRPLVANVPQMCGLGAGVPRVWQGLCLDAGD